MNGMGYWPMYLHEILSDIRLALAVGIFTSGWAFGLGWSLIFYLIGRHCIKQQKLITKKAGSMPTVALCDDEKAHSGLITEED